MSGLESHAGFVVIALGLDKSWSKRGPYFDQLHNTDYRGNQKGQIDPPSEVQISSPFAPNMGEK